MNYRPITDQELDEALASSKPATQTTFQIVALELKKARAELAAIAARDMGEVSDGYHTFNELYDHRIELFLALCEHVYWSTLGTKSRVWCSAKHADGTMFEGWFVMGIDREPGRQITYHLPIRFWDRAVRISALLFKAPEFDGHTPADVLKRLREIFRTPVAQ